MKRVTSNYLKRVSDVAKAGFSSSEEKESCVENVFTELEEEGLPVCCSPETSVIVEQFVTLATADNLNSLLEVMKTDLSMVMKDRYASHVLESVLVRSTHLICDYVQNFESESTDESNKNVSDAGKDSLTNHLLEICKNVYDGIESYITDSYSSHVLRTLLQVLGGTNVESKLSRQKKGAKNDQKKTTTFSDYAIPKSFKKSLKKMGKHIFALTQINMLLLDTHACAVIQVLLLVLHKVDTDICQKYIKHVIKVTKIGEEDTADNTRLPPVMTDKVGSYLIQQIISLASPFMYRKLYMQLFQGRMIQFAIHPKANFVLQSLINSCTEKDIFREQSGELEDNFEDVLAYGHYGVIVALAKTCQKMECKQKAFRQALMSALHCRDPRSRQKKIFRLTLMMKTFEVYFNLPEKEEKEEEKGEEKGGDKEGENKDEEEEEEIPEVPLQEVDINYSGSLIIQEMLRFTGIQLIEEGLLDLSADDICALSRNSFGCYVMEAIFQSAKVSTTAKNYIIQMVQEKSMDISCHRIGCQSIQSLWGYLNLTQKKLIASELCRDENTVRNDQYGRFVYSTLGLQHYTKRQAEWELAQVQEARKRRLFSNMLGTEIMSKRQKRSKDNSNDDHFVSREPFEVTNMYDPESDSPRGRGRGRGQFRGQRGGRGGHHEVRDNRGRGRGNFRGRDNFRGRGSQSENFGRGRGNFRGSDRYRGRGSHRETGSEHFGRGGGRGRGDFRGKRDSFRGRGKTDQEIDGGRKDNEEGKSASFGGRNNRD